MVCYHRFRLTSTDQSVLTVICTVHVHYMVCYQRFLLTPTDQSVLTVICAVHVHDIVCYHRFRLTPTTSRCLPSHVRYIDLLLTGFV
jgi:hypothetical protein